MLATSAPDAKNKTSISDNHLPGDTAMWIFVLGDLLIFTSYFIVYVVKRIQSPELFLESQRQLSLGIGVFNTVVLLTSSWFIASAADAARQGNDQKAMKLIKLCGLAGVIFVAIKAYEWSSKIQLGYTFTSNEFFSFYYFFTGIHLIHVLLGLGILAIVASKCRRGHKDKVQLIEIGATYWHMIDLLWVVILALLYMMR